MKRQNFQNFSKNRRYRQPASLEKNMRNRLMWSENQICHKAENNFKSFWKQNYLYSKLKLRPKRRKHLSLINNNIWDNDQKSCSRKSMSKWWVSQTGHLTYRKKEQIVVNKRTYQPGTWVVKSSKFNQKLFASNNNSIVKRPRKILLLSLIINHYSTHQEICFFRQGVCFFLFVGKAKAQAAKNLINSGYSWRLIYSICLFDFGSTCFWNKFSTLFESK